MRKLRTFCAILPLCLSYSLSVSASCSGIEIKKRKCHCSLETVTSTSDLCESLHLWKHTHRKNKNHGPHPLQRPASSRRDRANSAVGSLQCGCCLLWCGWPFKHHVALQDSDKTSWEVTKYPCGGHNTHTGDTHRGKTHTGATSWPRNIVWLRSLVQFPLPTAGCIPGETWQLESCWH